MTKRQAQVLEYLKSQSGYISPTQIGRDVFGTGHHSSTASPICKRLVSMGLAERSDKGHYRAMETSNE